MTSFPSLDELLWLFECEPEVQFADEAWPISGATWTTNRGSLLVVCTIVPYERSVQITISTAGERVAEIHLLGVVDYITVDRTHGAEALEAHCVSSAHLEPMRLQMKPHVSISATTAPPWRDA